jgi:hypothetical protein
VRGAPRWCCPGAGGLVAERGLSVPSAGSPRPARSHRVRLRPSASSGPSAARSARSAVPRGSATTTSRRVVWRVGRSAGAVSAGPCRACWPVPRLPARTAFVGPCRACCASGAFGGLVLRCWSPAPADPCVRWRVLTARAPRTAEPGRAERDLSHRWVGESPSARRPYPDSPRAGHGLPRLVVSLLSGLTGARGAAGIRHGVSGIGTDGAFHVDPSLATAWGVGPGGGRPSVPVPLGAHCSERPPLPGDV